MSFSTWSTFASGVPGRRVASSGPARASARQRVRITSPTPQRLRRVKRCCNFSRASLFGEFVNVPHLSVHEAALRWRVHEVVEDLAWHVVVDVTCAPNVTDV